MRYDGGVGEGRGGAVLSACSGSGQLFWGTGRKVMDDEKGRKALGHVGWECCTIRNA